MYEKPVYRKRFIILHAIFTWAFFCIALPFGVNITNITNSVAYTLLLGVYGGLWILFFWPLDIWIKPWGDRQGVGEWALKLLAFSTFFFGVWVTSCWPYCVTWPEYFEKIMATLVMFAFSYLTLSLIGKNQYLQSSLGVEKEEEIELIAEGEKKSIIVEVSRLLYFQADDNYVDVYYEKEGQLQKISLRTSLKSMSDQLSDYEAFFKPHRSYLINLSYFKVFDKKEQQIVLKMANLLFNFPLSAGKKKAFLELIGRQSLAVTKKVI
jgi:hypothetical protein